MGRSRKHQFKLTCGIFPFEVLFFIGYSKKESIDIMVNDHEWNRESLEDSFPYENEEGRGLYIMDFNNLSYVFLPTFRNNPRWYGIASHEILHVCIKVLEVVGQDINTTTWETICYLHQYLTQQMMAMIKE